LTKLYWISTELCELDPMVREREKRERWRNKRQIEGLLLTDHRFLFATHALVQLVGKGRLISLLEPVEDFGVGAS
jgi:hypothetical protein